MSCLRRWARRAGGELGKSRFAKRMRLKVMIALGGCQVGEARPEVDHLFLLTGEEDGDPRPRHAMGGFVSRRFGACSSLI